MGAPGTGKTLLCRECLRTGHTTDPWQSADAISEPERGNEADTPDENASDAHEKLLGKKLEHLATGGHPPFSVCEELSRLERIMRNDAMVAEPGKGACIFADEGFCQNYSRELADLEDRDAPLFRRLMKGRLVIFCEAPAETVVARIRKSQAHGRLMPLHRGRDDGRLLEMTRDAQHHHDRLRKAMERHALSFMTVDCSGPTHPPAREVRTTVRSVFASAGKRDQQSQ